MSIKFPAQLEREGIVRSMFPFEENMVHSGGSMY
jgi:hypothetical protein